jgi:hypothetical protein
VQPTLAAQLILEMFDSVGDESFAPIATARVRSVPGTKTIPIWNEI